MEKEEPIRGCNIHDKAPWIWWPKCFKPYDKDEPNSYLEWWLRYNNSTL